MAGMSDAEFYRTIERGVEERKRLCYRSWGETYGPGLALAIGLYGGVLLGRQVGALAANKSCKFAEQMIEKHGTNLQNYISIEQQKNWKDWLHQHQERFEKINKEGYKKDTKLGGCMIAAAMTIFLLKGLV